jgi:hypothetical protein
MNTNYNNEKIQGSSLKRLMYSLYRIVESLISQPNEYKSPKRFFGLPVLAIHIGPAYSNGQIRHTCGIFALDTNAKGVIAIGLFVSRGFFTLAALSYGAFCIGVGSISLVSVSVLGIGLISVSIFAFGYIAIGILAIGFKALGVFAFGQDAIGILAFGHTVRTLFLP